MEPKKLRNIYFDGYCVLCNGFLNYMLKHDVKDKFTYYSLNSEWAKKNIPDALKKVDSVVLEEDGKFFIKSSAVIKSLIQLGGIYNIFYISFIIPRFIRDYLYDLVARSRYRLFGKQDSCQILDPKLKAKVILK